MFGRKQAHCARQVPRSLALPAGAILVLSRCAEPGGAAAAAAAGTARSRSAAQAGENVAFSTALFLSQVRLKMLCDTVIDSNLGINTSPQAPAQLIICIINTHIK